MKKLLRFVFGFILIIILIIGVFLIFLVHYEVDSIEAKVKENRDNIEIELNYSESLNKYYSYSIVNDSGIISIKVKIAPFIGINWPKIIIIDEKLENIKTIEITDGSKLKVIYP